MNKQDIFQSSNFIIMIDFYLLFAITFWRNEEKPLVNSIMMKYFSYEKFCELNERDKWQPQEET